MSNFVRVAGAGEIKPGEGKTVSVNGNDVALFNVDGNFYAIDNTCPHRGGPLGEGFLEGDAVTCPWHGWRFNVTNGANIVMPNISVKAYKVKVENNEVLISLD